MAKKIIKLYYPAMMVFFVFTFANDILKSITQSLSLENILFAILWAFTAIHITAAYFRIISLSIKEYSIKAFVSDCVDIACIVYLCSYIGALCSLPGNHSYLNISAILVIVSVNQFIWFVFMRNFDVPAILRILILFIGMIVISFFEIWCHSIWNLLAVVILIAILALLRIINKAPDIFYKLATYAWTKVKDFHIIRK